MPRQFTWSQPGYSSVQVMAILREDGIPTARDRVNRMADRLFPRDPEQWARNRQISKDQLLLIRQAFLLIKGGVPASSLSRYAATLTKRSATSTARAQESAAALEAAVNGAETEFRPGHQVLPRRRVGGGRTPSS